MRYHLLGLSSFAQLPMHGTLNQHGSEVINLQFGLGPERLCIKVYIAYITPNL